MLVPWHVDGPDPNTTSIPPAALRVKLILVCPAKRTTELGRRRWQPALLGGDDADHTPSTRTRLTHGDDDVMTGPPHVRGGG